MGGAPYTECLIARSFQRPAHTHGDGKAETSGVDLRMAGPPDLLGLSQAIVGRRNDSLLLEVGQRQQTFARSSPAGADGADGGSLAAALEQCGICSGDADDVLRLSLPTGSVIDRQTGMANYLPASGSDRGPPLLAD